MNLVYGFCDIYSLQLMMILCVVVQIQTGLSIGHGLKAKNLSIFGISPRSRRVSKGFIFLSLCACMLLFPKRLLKLHHWLRPTPPCRPWRGRETISGAFRRRSSASTRTVCRPRSAGGRRRGWPISGPWNSPARRWWAASPTKKHSLGT